MQLIVIEELILMFFTIWANDSEITVPVVFLPQQYFAHYSVPEKQQKPKFDRYSPAGPSAASPRNGRAGGERARQEIAERVPEELCVACLSGPVVAPV